MTKQIEKARDLIAMIEVKEPGELIVNSWWGSFVEDYREALQIAINVLEQQPETEAKEYKNGAAY